MKRFLLFAAGALLAIPAVSPVAFAKPLPLNSSAPLRQSADPKLQTFTGTVLKNGEKLVLNDAADKLSYVLDDAKKASAYEGKKVKVTGTVDVASNMIHVQTIEEIA